MRIQLRNKLNENKLKAGNRINDLANVCILSGKRTAEVREPVNKGRLLNNPVVNKSVENATSCDFEKQNCDPPVRCTNVSHPSEVGRKEFNVNRSSDCDVEMKVGVCKGRVKTVAMGAHRVINLDNIGDGSFELKRDKAVANPEGLIFENSCDEKYTLGTLMGCEKQLTVNRESFRNHTIAKVAGPLKGKGNTCKADVRTCLEDGLAMRLPLSEPREIYKDSLATDNRSNISSEFTFEIDLPGKRDRSTIYRLDLIKLYRRKPELENLVMKNSSEGIDSETLYSVKLFMDVGFQGNLRKSQLYFKLPPDRSSYLRMINAKKKERFLPGPGTIVLRQKDINLVTGKPFRIKTCCSSQMLINSLREDAKYLLDLGVNGMGQSNRTLPVVWLGRVNRYPYPRFKCIKYGNFNQGFVNVILETGCVMDKCVHMWTRNYGALGQTARVCFGVGQVCPDVDKELWRLGPDGSGDEETRKRKKGGDPKGEVEEKRSEKTRAGRLRKRRGESQSFDPCCCPRVENTDEKERLMDRTETSCGESGFKTGIPYRF
ncbi:uncharacterized protein TNCV_4249801 [Trichonephila clavipes]|nr:uncharacterized protein TNCV_4249801 [Trichonephila clavipes]